MKVGIIGSGDVGQALGKGFIEKGHAVKLGTRNTNDTKHAGWLKNSGKNASLGTFAETAEFGEVIIIAVKGNAVEESIKLAGLKNFKGKLVIDVTNPLDCPTCKRPTTASNAFICMTCSIKICPVCGNGNKGVVASKCEKCGKLL